MESSLIFYIYFLHATSWWEQMKPNAPKIQFRLGDIHNLHRQDFDPIPLSWQAYICTYYRWDLGDPPFACQRSLWITSFKREYYGSVVDQQKDVSLFLDKTSEPAVQLRDSSRLKNKDTSFFDAQLTLCIEYTCNQFYPNMDYKFSHSLCGQID